jgi:hypothetical protein
MLADIVLLTNNELFYLEFACAGSWSLLKTTPARVSGGNAALQRVRRAGLACVLMLSRYLPEVLAAHVDHGPDAAVFS